MIDLRTEDAYKRIILSNETKSVRHLCSCDELLNIVIINVGEIVYTLHHDSFSFMVDTIIGQMLSNKVADVISERLRSVCGGDMSPQGIRALSISDLRGIGLSAAKSEYIQGFATHCCEYPNFFDSFSIKSDKEVMGQLMKLRGIGSWSAKMYLIFVLDRPDVLPFEDGAFQQAFKWLYPNVNYVESSIKMHCERWRPYASIASRYLYKALDSGLTKRPFQNT